MAGTGRANPLPAEPGTSHLAACKLPAPTESLEAQLERLAICQRNAKYLAQLGRTFNTHARYAEALDHLERALMLNPDEPGAELDYAIALAGSGELLSAQLLIDSIIQRPALEPGMRRALQQARQRLEAVAIRLGSGSTPSQSAPDIGLAMGESAPLAWRFSTSTRFGHDTNLLGAPGVQSLSLTFPTGVVELPLTDTNAPRPGNYGRLDARLELGSTLPGSYQWTMAANWQKRASPTVQQSNTRLLDWALDFQPDNTRWGWYGGVSRLLFESGAGTHYASTGASLGLQSALASTPWGHTCTLRAGAEVQERTHLSTPQLSGMFKGLTGMWVCSTNSGLRWQWAARLGQDRPNGAAEDRPGAHQTTAATHATLFFGPWMLDVDLAHTQDSTGYSPLLDNNAHRATRRFNARVEYLSRLKSSLSVTLGAEWSLQQSNLALFNVQGWGPYANLRYAW